MMSFFKYIFSFLLSVSAALFFVPCVSAFEHPHYEITARFDEAEKKITGRETVSFTNNTKNPVGEIFFHIYANRKYTQKERDFIERYAGYFKINPFPEGFDSGHLNVESVESGGEQLTFAVEGDDETILRVPLKRSLSPGETVKLTLFFAVHVPHAYGRFGWNDNIAALSRWYPILSVLDEDGWKNHPFYPFHRPFFSDASYYDVKLTVPADQVVIHSGEMKDESAGGQGEKVISFTTSFPIREFSLSMSRDYKVMEEMHGSTKIKAFYLKGDEAHAKEALESALGTFSFYTKLFGEYPYPEFSIAPVYLGYGGEQMSNMAFIDTRVFGLPRFLDRYFDFLISHESGHQWFYNLIGVDGFSELWLEEGVNSYFNLLYLEDKYGRDAFVAELPKELQWLLPNFSFRRGRDYRYKLIARTRADKPVTGKLSSFTEPANIFSITYGKGSQIISMLRELIGNEAFNRVFERVFTEYRFKNMTTGDFMRLCQEESDRDVAGFFERWLHTTKKLDVAVKDVRGNKIILENRGEIMMPVEIEVEFADGTKNTMMCDVHRKEEVLELASSAVIKRVRADPQEKLLDIDRTNNSWPRKLNVKFVPLYVGLYDIPLFVPDNGYNLIMGPEIANGIGVKASLQKPYDQNFYAATDYSPSEELSKSRLGYRLNNVGHTFRSAGFELFNTNDLDDDSEDLAGGKIYVRQELWPASYGLLDVNDHVTFYLLRNRSLSEGFSLSDYEDVRNTSYLKHDEAILGGLLHLGRFGPYPDPNKGYKMDVLLENSNHMLGATQYFYRSSMDWAVYHPVTQKTKLALHLKYGWGYPYDKNLYELGGMDGLRGFDRKTVRGSRAALSSLEYRFPIRENLKLKAFDNILGLESFSGVAFVDSGAAWFDTDHIKVKNDIGLGLRATVNIGSFLEKIILRFDIAQPLNKNKDEDDKDTHFWFGAGHAF